jgi:hypothetical protein
MPFHCYYGYSNALSVTFSVCLAELPLEASDCTNRLQYGVTKAQCNCVIYRTTERRFLACSSRLALRIASRYSRVTDTEHEGPLPLILYRVSPQQRRTRRPPGAPNLTENIRL